ncbi:MAG: hypothetical protein ABIK62_08265 [candidate division WOR-3 bacterium]
MSKAKVGLVVLLSLAGLVLFASCSKPKAVLHVSIPEGGYYPVDVRIWIQVPNPEPGEPDIWTWTYRDATVDCELCYYQTGAGVPTYPSENILRLDRYSITWTPASPQVKLPGLSGALDVYLRANFKGDFVTVPVLVMPAVCKDTVSAFSGIVGDPEEQIYTGGQILAKGRIKFEGTDLLTGEAITGEATINAVFADYMDPNKLH